MISHSYDQHWATERIWMIDFAESLGFTYSTCISFKQGGWNEWGQGAKLIKSLNQIHQDGGILQKSNKREEGNLWEEGGKI